MPAAKKRKSYKALYEACLKRGHRAPTKARGPARKRKPAARKTKRRAAPKRGRGRKGSTKFVTKARKVAAAWKKYKKEYPGNYTKADWINFQKEAWAVKL